MLYTDGCTYGQTNGQADSSIPPKTFVFQGYKKIGDKNKNTEQIVLAHDHITKSYPIYKKLCKYKIKIQTKTSNFSHEQIFMHCRRPHLKKIRENGEISHNVRRCHTILID